MTAIFAYWFALKDEGELPLRHATAFLLSWYSSLLWGMIVTLIHILGGATIYENGLQALSMHSNWLVAGTLAFYFGAPKTQARVTSAGAQKNPKAPVKLSRDLIRSSLVPLGFKFCARSGCGGFFLFPNVARLAPRNTGTESTAGERFASTVARKAKIALGPGVVYGDQGADHVRIVFTRELEALQQAVDRIGIALA